MLNSEVPYVRYLDRSDREDVRLHQPRCHNASAYGLRGYMDNTLPSRCYAITMILRVRRNFFEITTFPNITLSCPLSRLTPLSFLVAMALRLSPFARTSAVAIPRQLAPTVGPTHGGFEFLKGNFEWIKGYAVGRMTKSHRGKLYIDDANWGPDAGSIEYGYQVPFGGIHASIGKIGDPGPKPDICTDLIETAQLTRPARA